jgi:hypothetical protein
METVVQAANVAPHPGGAGFVGVNLEDQSPILDARFELPNPIPLTLERLWAAARDAV